MSIQQSLRYHQICAECILFWYALFDVHFVPLTFILLYCHCHFADYRIVFKLQNITNFELKWNWFAVYFQVSVRIYPPIWANTVMSVSDICPTPLFELMLLGLSYLADANVHLPSESVDAHCPFAYSIVICLAVCYATNWIIDISVLSIGRTAEDSPVDFRLAVFHSCTPS